MTPAEIERLGLLAEEMGEVQQLIGKILRHGYESRWPRDTGTTNREKLKGELIDLMLAQGLLVQSGDISPMTTEELVTAVDRKNRWLHHNVIPRELFELDSEDADNPEELVD